MTYLAGFSFYVFLVMGTLHWRMEDGDHPVSGAGLLVVLSAAATAWLDVAPMAMPELLAMIGPSQ